MHLFGTVVNPISTHCNQYNILHRLGVWNHRTPSEPNLFSICDYSGQQSRVCVHLTSSDSLHQTQTVIHASNHYYHYQNPVVIMGRHPADKPSVLQVEINVTPSLLSALYFVLKDPNIVRVEMKKRRLAVMWRGLRKARENRDEWGAFTGSTPSV